MKLYTKLVGLQFKVVYKPGSSNLVADDLSWHPSPPTHLHAILSSSLTWLAEVVAGCGADPASHKLNIVGTIY
jgi:hypothetical protein